MHRLLRGKSFLLTLFSVLFDRGSRSIVRGRLDVRNPRKQAKYKNPHQKTQVSTPVLKGNDAFGLMTRGRRGMF